MSDLNIYPMNVVDEVAVSLEEYLDDEVVILKRPLRPSDPYRSVGIFPTTNDVVAGSLEIGGNGEPTLQQYMYRIQNLCRHADEVLGRRQYAVDTKIIKTILYRDPALRLRLAALNDVSLGFQERFQKFTVGTQRYINNELNGQFMYLSVTEFSVETEVAVVI